MRKAQPSPPNTKLTIQNGRLSNGGSYGELKLLPFWDPLHGDPRFEQIVA